MPSGRPPRPRSREMSVAEAAIYTGVPSVVVIGAIGYFRAEVRKFLGNARQLKAPGGFELNSDPHPQVAVDPEAPALPASTPERPPEPTRANAALPPASPLVVQIEDTLRQELQARTPGDDAAQLTVAVRALATSRVALAHEANYRVIFSTQIMLLKSLNDGSIRHVEQARFWYDVFHQRMPDAPLTFENWLQFLINAGYVQLDEITVGAPRGLTLDVLGQDFLLWMIHNRISENRPG